jgi:excisionase family DNA binding protein
MSVPVTDSIDRLLTVEDVMANLRISRPTLYRLLKSNVLIPVRIGKRTLFDPADIRAFVEASKRVDPVVNKAQQKEPKKIPKKAAQPRKPKPKLAEATAETLPQAAARKPRKTKQPKEKAPDDADRQGRLL